MIGYLYGFMKKINNQYINRRLTGNIVVRNDAKAKDGSSGISAALNFTKLFPIYGLSLQHMVFH